MTVTDQQHQEALSLIRQLQIYDLKYEGDPNSNLDGVIGATCRDITPGTGGTVYRKTTDLGDLTGWVTP